MASKQPSGLARINWGSKLASVYLESVFLGSAPGVNLVNGKAFTKVGSPVFGGGTQGNVGPVVNLANAYYITDVVSSAAWTIACVITRMSNWGSGAFVMGNSNPVNNGTNDRSLEMNASLQYGVYVFDGTSKKATTAAQSVVGFSDNVVIWCDGSTAGVNFNNNTEATVAVSNSGFTGYGSPGFAIGSVDTGANANVAIHLALRVQGEVWSASKRQAFMANPWDLVEAPARRVFLGPAAGVADTLWAQACL
jgi:hypothetical protein